MASRIQKRMPPKFGFGAFGLFTSVVVVFPVCVRTLIDNQHIHYLQFLWFDVNAVKKVNHIDFATQSVILFAILQGEEGPATLGTHTCCLE
jgi:hypothetical protein